MGIADGQTVIKERIELQPQQGHLQRDSDNDLVYIAEDSGTFAGTVILARKYNPIVTGRLSITRRGTTFEYNLADYLDFITNRRSDEWRCDNGYHIEYMEYHARSWYDTPLRFFLPDVHVGDTLRFMYHGSVDIAPTNVGGGGGGFGVDMILPEDVCYTYWEGELHEREVCSIGMYIMYPDTAGFRLVTEKDTVSYREASAVRAIAVSSDGGEVQIDSTTMIRYTMVPDTLGSFISAVPETSNTVDARYADARAGRIKFVANKSKPDSVRPVVINVVQLNDTTKRGSKIQWVRSNDTVVTITRPDSAVVYPTYQNHNQTNTTRNYIDLELRVTFKNDSVPNCWVKIRRPVLADSGGHSHDGNRPMGKYKYPRTSGSALDTIVARTDSTGRVRFRYVASQFGGVERIRATLLSSDTTKFDTLSLMTRVPALQRLSDGATYVKVGGRCAHHGPSTSEPSACRTPDNNHWGTQRMLDSLQAGMRKFYDWSGSRKGGGHHIQLHVNDMSLPLGGTFDIDGNWALNHHLYHRLGLSVDIDSAGSGLNSTQIKELTSIMEKKLGLRDPERPMIHYGFFGGH